MTSYSRSIARGLEISQELDHISLNSGDCLVPGLSLVAHVPCWGVGGEELDGWVAHDLVLSAGWHVGLHGTVNGRHGHHTPPAVDVLRQRLECRGKVDAVAAPGGIELHQPGRAAPAYRGLEVGVVQQNYFVIGVIKWTSSSCNRERNEKHAKQETSNSQTLLYLDYSDSWC